MRKDLNLVSISLFIWGLGESLFIIFQPLYLQELGADPFMIGSILSANGFAMMCVQIPVGYLSDRLGKRRLMWASWVLGVIAAALMALTRNLTVFIIGLLLYGLTAAGVSAMNSYITEARGNWSVGRAITFASAAYNAGTIAGPILGGMIADRWELRSLYMVATAFFIISTVVIFLIGPQAKTSPHENADGVSIWRNRRYFILLGLVFLVTFATFLAQPLASSFLQNERGLSYAEIGRLGSMGGVGNVVLMLLAGFLPAQLAFVLGQAGVAVFAATLWRGTGSIWYLLGYFFLGGFRVMRAMTLAFVRPLIHKKEIGLAYGILETVNGIAYIATPLLAGILYDRAAGLVFPVALIALAVTISISIGFGWWERRLLLASGTAEGMNEKE